MVASTEIPPPEDRRLRTALMGIGGCVLGAGLILAIPKSVVGDAADPYLEFFTGAAGLTIAIQLIYANTRPLLASRSVGADGQASLDENLAQARRYRTFVWWLIGVLMLTGLQLSVSASTKLVLGFAIDFNTLLRVSERNELRDSDAFAKLLELDREFQSQGERLRFELREPAAEALDEPEAPDGPEAPDEPLQLGQERFVPERSLRELLELPELRETLEARDEELRERLEGELKDTNERRQLALSSNTLLFDRQIVFERLERENLQRQRFAHELELSDIEHRARKQIEQELREKNLSELLEQLELLELQDLVESNELGELLELDLLNLKSDQLRELLDLRDQALDDLFEPSGADPRKVFELFVLLELLELQTTSEPGQGGLELFERAEMDLLRVQDQRDLKFFELEQIDQALREQELREFELRQERERIRLELRQEKELDKLELQDVLDRPDRAWLRNLIEQRDELFGLLARPMLQLDLDELQRLFDLREPALFELLTSGEVDTNKLFEILGIFELLEAVQLLQKLELRDRLRGDLRESSKLFQNLDLLAQRENLVFPEAWDSLLKRLALFDPWIVLVLPYFGLLLLMFIGMVHALLSAYRPKIPHAQSWVAIALVLVGSHFALLLYNTAGGGFADGGLQVVRDGLARTEMMLAYGAFALVAVSRLLFVAARREVEVQQDRDLSSSFFGFMIITLLVPISVGVTDFVLRWQISGALTGFFELFWFNEFVIYSAVLILLSVLIWWLGSILYPARNSISERLVTFIPILLAALILLISFIPGAEIVRQWSFTFGVFVLGGAYLVVQQTEIANVSVLEGQTEVAKLQQRETERATQVAHAEEIRRNASVAAHEIANPVGGALRFLNSETMHRALSDGKDADAWDDRAFLRDRLDSQVRGLEGTLAFVQLIRETGSIQDVRAEAMDLPRFIQGMVQDYALQHDLAEAITIDETFGRNPIKELQVRAHPTLLTNVLRILFDNSMAAKHPDRPLTIALSVAREERQVVLSIRDNGMGMDTSTQESYGEPPRGDANRPGRGLGVYGARYFMQRMGGELRLAASTQGEGSTVALYFKHA